MEGSSSLSWESHVWNHLPAVLSIYVAILESGINSFSGFTSIRRETLKT